MEVESCRICLSSDVRELTSLFTSQDGRNYAELVSFCCGIVIDPSDDQLPKNICFDCLLKVKSACEIKRKCMSTDLLLKQKLKNEQQNTNDVELKLLVEYVEDKTCLVSAGSSSLIDGAPSKNLRELTSEEFLAEEPSSPRQEKQPKVQRKQKKGKTANRQGDTEQNKNKKPEQHDYRCFICERMFELIQEKDLHVKQAHTDIKVCRICNQRKQTAISLETHLRYHLVGYRFLCSICGKSFRFRNLLENHLKVEHEQSVRFCCDLCEYSTKFKINLERHVKSVHMKLKNFKCEKCVDHNYSTQVGLNLHRYRIHGVEAPVTCTDCQQGFTFESELRVHKKHCTGSSLKIQRARPQDAPVDILENGFRCKVCLQIFDARSKWSVHYHHKHKNSNICGFCNKQMASSTSLFKHIQVQHNNIKKFQCDICMKTFGFKHSLESHKNTHTGDKPFACNVCNFRSGDRSTISKHKKKMHA